MLDGMDSRLPPPFAAPVLPATVSPLPAWANGRARDSSEGDAAFAAGIALKSLDDLVRADLPWAGCWRQRLALRASHSAVQLIGRNEGEAGLRDVVLLTAPGNDPGPAGAMYLAFQKLAAKKRPISSKVLEEVAALMGMRREGLSEIADLFDGALQSGRAVPFVVADLVTNICAARPDAEILAWVAGRPPARGKTRLGVWRAAHDGRAVWRSVQDHRWPRAGAARGARFPAGGVPGARVRHGRGLAAGQ